MNNSALARTVDDFKSFIHISNNQMRTFLQCPQKYQFQYVRGMEWEFIPDYLPFGRAIHKGAEVFYRHIADKGTKPTVNQLHDAFKAEWEEGLKRNVRFKEDAATLEQKGLQMLELFYEQANPSRILGVEVPFSVEIVDPATGEALPCQLVGIFDLIEADEDGNPIVVELKTGSKRYSDGQLDIDLQATLYGYALSKMGYSTGVGNILIRFDLLLKTKKPAMEKYFTLRNALHYRRAIRTIKQVLKAIEREAFFPIAGWHCADCPFQTACKEN